MVSFVEYPIIKLSDQFPALYQNRYCDQEDFSIAVFGGEKLIEYCIPYKPFLLENFDTKIYLPCLVHSKNGCKAIASGSDIYLADHNIVSDSYSNELYSSSTSWKTLPLLDEDTEYFGRGRYYSFWKKSYNVCAFMQKLFVISGKNVEDECDRSCMVYDKQSDSWNYIAYMMEGREKAACTVFEGRIVVSGGSYAHEYDYNQKLLDTVEAYDHHEDKWSYFEPMLSQRSNHTAVSISNKMFMIGGNDQCFRTNCEVFDSVTEMFTSITSIPEWIDYYVSDKKTVCVGYNIYFFAGEKYGEVNIYSFDIMKNSFSFKTSLYLDENKSFSCTKVPMY